VTIYVVRHAKAGARDAWEGPDHDRPLSDGGHQQANGLVGLFARRSIEAIGSSPFVRCLQTIEPLARTRGLDIEKRAGLAEGAGTKAIWDLVRSGARDSVICTHGDVVQELLDELDRNGVDLGSNPRLQKGSTWVLEASDGSVKSTAYLPPP
jgi:8-oxo-dGTP diphosphatase